MKSKYFTLQKIHKHYFSTKVYAKLHVHDAKKRQTNLFLIIEVNVNNVFANPWTFFESKNL
jgi:hypothetical protein